MLLGSRGPKRTDLIDLEHVFKAKKVTFWEVFRLIAENTLFARKVAFAREFAFLRGILAFLVKGCTFPVLGPQKTSQKLVFIKGFEQGTQKGAFGAQKCFYWSRTALLAKKPLILLKWRGYQVYSGGTRQRSALPVIYSSFIQRH